MVGRCVDENLMTVVWRGRLERADGVILEVN